ncbi:D-alanine--D-alanine ligase family protein [Gallionella capsiferriformans]|uniref:D-alanine--D-alanine ligase domain protein n=1 Tax=Gallionella capsiferriformans (strain ES-2) TaxID=395494 RepID=D9SG04_GALCS|nr:D-alanine--D-alanine ligase [Gallionella capsiferriformans]ADL55451.1 D-alanine--D-alanine ligase domain protein [Gallionella capsiferriformans ES-2]
MIHSNTVFPFRDVVLIADKLGESEKLTPIHKRRDLEMTDAQTLDTLRSTINSLGLRVHTYNGPDDLAKNAALHSNDIVLSIYGGRASRNRMALVPAICETFGLRFIGPDVYGRIVAQDKEVTKRLASDCGIITPAWRIVRSVEDLRYISGLRLPVVIKPLMEGSSIGIAQRNRVVDVADVLPLAKELLETFNQPVLIEEFVAGREVAYSKIQHAGAESWAFSEVVIEGNDDYFTNHLFDADEKLIPTVGRTIRNIDHELHANDRAAIDTFLTMFGAYGYCRVDGRLADGNFHFLELTPDAWIAPRGQFARGFTEKGWSYAEVIAAVLASVD